MSSSNQPYTYRDILSMIDLGNMTQLGVEVRNNTYAERDGEDFNILYYGTRIARLRPDGVVILHRTGRESVSTINRLNDVLIPLGWSIKRRSFSEGGERVRKWMLVTTSKPRRSMEFIDGMILTKFVNDTKDN